MFFEEGWAAIADVTAEVTERVEAFHARANAQSGGAPVPRKAVLEDVAISVWEICDAATKVGVTTAAGTLVPASKRLLDWEDPRRLWNRHLDLRLGNVGSAPIPGVTDAELRARYGAFLHLPLAIPENGVESSLSFLDEELANKEANREAELEVAARIVAAFDAGQTLTRRLARAEFGAKLSRRSFKMAWAAAMDVRPALAADPDQGEG
ncbi:MAG: hypothetical protein D6811_11235 [Alphaproteobacteria bacterium]|nr:MAG: hypothetical protein D6811_11235 [Alphaproteobacteria bacterium]